MTFSETEIKEEFFQMGHNKALGPDRFLAEFYQSFQEVIKYELVKIFNEFHNGNFPFHNLNFGVITLLPKKFEATKIKQYRPICLLNVSFKVFKWFSQIELPQQLKSNQTPTLSAFWPGRYILKGVVVLHETIHEMRRKNKNGVILILDFEKAYDNVKWSFLQQMLRMKCFSSQFCAWIDKVTCSGSVGIKVNKDIGHYFETKKGVRQGDPLSPILLNIVVDMLPILIARAKENGRFRGMVPHLVDDGLTIIYGK